MLTVPCLINSDIEISTLRASQLPDFDESNYYIVDNKLRVSWAAPKGWRPSTDIPLMSFNANATPATAATATIDRLIAPQAYLANLEVYDLVITDGKTATTADEAYMGQNLPNPFSEVTAIDFYTPVDGEFMFYVRSVDGKLLYSKSYSFSAGEHTIRLNANDIDMKGVMVYEVVGDDVSLSRRMIKVE